MAKTNSEKGSSSAALKPQKGDSVAKTDSEKGSSSRTNLYAAIVNHIFHTDTGSWTRIGYFLVFNSLLVVAGISAYTEPARTKWLVVAQCLTAGIGILGSFIWLLHVRRCRKYLLLFLEMAKKIESELFPEEASRQNDIPDAVYRDWLADRTLADKNYWPPLLPISAMLKVQERLEHDKLHHYSSSYRFLPVLIGSFIVIHVILLLAGVLPHK